MRELSSAVGGWLASKESTVPKGIVSPTENVMMVTMAISILFRLPIGVAAQCRA